MAQDLPPNDPVARGPGTYCVHGIDQATTQQKIWRCVAMNATEAKEKARSAGIMASSVQREN